MYVYLSKGGDNEYMVNSSRECLNRSDIKFIIQTTEHETRVSNIKQIFGEKFVERENGYFMGSLGLMIQIIFEECYNNIIGFDEGEINYNRAINDARASPYETF